MKKSLMYNFSKEEYLEFIKSSNSIRELMNYIGYRDVGNNRITLFKVLKTYGLESELEELKKRSILKSKERIAVLNSYNTKEISDALMFCENSKVPRKDVKKRLLNKQLLEYKCAICGNNGEYNGLPLILQLDHINGVNNDNRLENLRFLCPNCHSQTETFSGRKNKKPLENKQHRKKEDLEKLEERKKYLLNIDTSKFGWVAEVAKDWGISHTSVKRWIKRNCPDIKYYQRKRPLP